MTIAMIITNAYLAENLLDLKLSFTQLLYITNCVIYSIQLDVFLINLE